MIKSTRRGSKFSKRIVYWNWLQKLIMHIYRETCYKLEIDGSYKPGQY